VCPDNRSNHREYNNIQASTTDTGLLRLPFTVNNIQTFVMIDSGANGCFISERFMQQHGIATRKKKAIYKLRAVNGSALPDVTRETDTIRLTHQQHLEDTSLDIVEIANHDIILGIPWLE
jgi:predicted aspartyl protease